MINLDELEAKARAATQGNWKPASPNLVLTGNKREGIKGKGSYFEAKCVCGESIWASRSAYTAGNRFRKSCGCLRGVTLLGRSKFIKPSRTTEYVIWRSMIERCRNPRNHAYPRYGGSGITVSQEWLNSFDKFYLDMGDRPYASSLDRIDGSSGYSKENCRWATASEQTWNSRKDTGGLAKVGPTRLREMVLELTAMLEISDSERLKLIAAMRVYREALGLYAAGRHLWAESAEAPKGVNVCPPIGYHAKEALAEADKILGGGA